MKPRHRILNPDGGTVLVRDTDGQPDARVRLGDVTVSLADLLAGDREVPVEVDRKPDREGSER